MQQSNSNGVQTAPKCSSCPCTGIAGRTVKRSPTPVVITILEPGIRGLVNVAVHGSLSPVHVESADEALDAARRLSARALIVSANTITRRHAPAIGRVVAECPGVVPVALVTERGPVSNDVLLWLGANGEGRLLDLRAREGWCRLRCLIDESGGEAARHILDAILTKLDRANAPTKHFFTVLVRSAPTIATVRDFANVLDVCPSTMVSRFYRAHLPSPKQYLGGIRLVFASAYLAEPARSIASVAERLQFSSAQSFGRTVQHTLGMKAGELRDKYPFNALLEHYIFKFVEPFKRKFAWFDPIGRDSRSVRVLREDIRDSDCVA